MERHQFEAFPPIMPQVMFNHERRNSEPLTKPTRPLLGEPATEDEAKEFELPQYEGQKRPRLDNIFPMHDPPPATSGGARNLAISPGVGGGAAVGRSSSFNETDSRLREREAARGEEEEEERDEVDGRGGRGHVRGASIDSSGSEDRTLERRQRRMGVVRKIPQLPQRKLDWSEVQSLPEFGPRRRRPTPIPPTSPFGYDFYHHHHHHAQPFSPPRGPMAHHFGYPPWGAPPTNLPPLSEESDSGDIKGFDEFKLY